MSGPSLEIRCIERDPTLELELVADPSVEDRLVGDEGKEEGDPLLKAPAKNACLVCRTSVWISRPARSRQVSSSLRTTLSLDS